MIYKLVDRKKRKIKKKKFNFFFKGFYKNDLYLYKYLYDNIENFSCLNMIMYIFVIYNL